MTSTALDLNHATPAALAIQPGQISWDTTQIAALGQLGLADASDGDRAVFLHVCQRTGLDPFARQIYMIARKEQVPGSQNQYRTKWTIQTGIDGFRVNRDRAERKAGMRGVLGRAVFYDPDGNEHKAWLQPRPPVACEITYTVRDKNGNETPYTSVLRFTEYCQVNKDGNLIAQWASKPAHMLEKCTEADVYRKAFPQDFSGMYLDDAMPPQPEAQPAPPRGRVTAGEIIDDPPASNGAAQQEAPKPAARTARRKTAAAGDEPRNQNDGTGASPEAAGAAPSRDPQPLPPLTEDDPGTASADQLTSLHITFGGLGFGGGEDDKKRKLKLAETITGRDLGGTSKNLSYTEARKLVDTLDGFGGDQGKLIAHMATLEQDGHSDG